MKTPDKTRQMCAQIDQLLGSDCTLFAIHVKSTEKIAVLLHIAQDLSPTTKYPKNVLNAIVAKYHDDNSTIPISIFFNLSRFLFERIE